MNLKKQVPKSSLFLLAWVIPSLMLGMLIVDPPTKMNDWPYKPFITSNTPVSEVAITYGIAMFAVWILTGLIPWLVVRRLNSTLHGIHKIS